ncbi:MAG: glycosyltransferase family 4 protein [Acidobacteriia bacterium]|nr:glycosyltransferase family 4 protein [Terriglobia bacterium]
MKIAIDSWTLGSRFRYQGTYVYAQSVVEEFRKIAQRRSDLEFCLFSGSGGSNDARLLESGAGISVSSSRLLNYTRLWRLGGMGRAAACVRADLVFIPAAGTAPVSRLPVVSTIHDATPLKMPSQSPRAALLARSMMWSAARFSQAVITDSQHSRRDLMELYGLPESKVSVVYLGYDKSAFHPEVSDPVRYDSLLKRLRIERPYILHHGTVQPRKNLRRLIEAWRMVLDRNPNLQFDLVLAGKLGWEYNDTVAAASEAAPRGGRVVLAGAVETADLALLIKGAALAVAPSLYEGFCLPMIESMACGTPTIAASASCLPEISGGVLRYFDPQQVEDMAGCIEQTLEDDALRKDLSRKGIERAACFDWGRCASETLAVLESVLA